MFRGQLAVRTALHLAFALLGMAGLACLCFILWSYDYAVIYGLELRSWDVFKALDGGQWLLPHDQANAYQPDARIARVITSSFIALGVELLVGVGGLLALIFQPFRPHPPKGGAKMATVGDLEKEGFFKGKPGSSILLGRVGGREVRFTGDAHFFVNGPSRSGKGRGFVMPNLLEWKGSVIVIDAKAENWNYTAKARMLLGQKVFFFAPGSAQSHRWNPLDFVRRWPERATDLQNLAATLVPLSAKEKETIWKETAQALCSACLGYVLESRLMEGRRHLRSVYRLFAYGGGFPAFCAKVLKDEPDLHPFILDAFRMHMARNEEAQRSFEGNVTAPLKAWGNELVAAATSASDFDIAQLRRTPISIYIGCSPGDLRSVETVIRLFIEQVHTLMLLRLPDLRNEPHKLLVMLDEFYQFNAMTEITQRAPIALGYNVTFAVIAQNIPQFDERYTRATRESFLGNMDIRLFIAIGDKLTADLVSESLGDHYVMTESWGRGSNSRATSNIRWEARPLRTNAQLESMPKTKELLYVRGLGGIELDKINFHEDRFYKKMRAGIESRKVSLPDLNLALLAEWPLQSESPSAEALDRERERKHAAYAVPTLSQGKESDVPELDMVPRTLATAAARVFVKPLRLLMLVQEALAHPDNSSAAVLLQNLRLDPAQYGALHHLQDKRSPLSKILAGRKPADTKLDTAIKSLRDEIVSARRAVVADRARRFALGETAGQNPASSPAPVIRAAEAVVTEEQEPALADGSDVPPSLSGANESAGQVEVQSPAGGKDESEGKSPKLSGPTDAATEDDENEAGHVAVETMAVPETPSEMEVWLASEAAKVNAARYNADVMAATFASLQTNSTSGLKKGRRTKQQREAA